ncbi:MAG: L,D-transpeptidase family protein [Burkholderiaceae bacterium]
MMFLRRGFAVWIACGSVWATHPAVQARTLALPPEHDALIGSITTVSARYEDTLPDIARAHEVGYQAIVSANPGVDPWVPGAGTPVLVPTRHVLPDAPRTGVVLNLPEFRLYHYHASAPGEPARVSTYPVSIGDVDWRTPLGLTRITSKVKRPSWYPPASIRAEHARNGTALPAVVPPGPDNPLGEFALRLAVPGGYLIHGTNKPYGIGMRVTHGCVRLYPEHIARLYAELPVGTPVRIVDQPIKAGWEDGVLYLEVHAPLAESRSESGVTAAVRAVIAATKSRSAVIDWDAVTRAARERRGVPVPVSR